MKPNSCPWTLAGRTMILAVACLFGNQSEAAVIRFRPSIESAATIVRLGDIAEILNADPKEVQTLSAIILAPVPGSGGELRLDMASIRSRLAAQGVNLATTELTGSSVVVVTSPREASSPPRATPIPDRTSQSQHDRVEQLVTRSVTQYLQRVAPELGRVQIAVSVERKDVPALMAGAVHGYEIAGGTRPWNATQTMTVRTLDRTNSVTEVPVICQVFPQPFVLALKHTVPKGHVLQPGDLAWRQSEVTDGAFSRIDEVVGRETQRSIRQDEIVRAVDIRTIPLVRSNDIVTVTSRAGGIQVRRQMKARSDGAPGETVTLITLTGRETVVGRVTGFHEAEVVTAGGTVTDEIADDAGKIRFVRETAPR